MHTEDRKIKISPDVQVPGCLCVCLSRSPSLFFSHIHFHTQKVDELSFDSRRMRVSIVVKEPSREADIQKLHSKLSPSSVSPSLSTAPLSATASPLKQLDTSAAKDRLHKLSEKMALSLSLSQSASSPPSSLSSPLSPSGAASASGPVASKKELGVKFADVPAEVRCALSYHLSFVFFLKDVLICCSF